MSTWNVITITEAPGLTERKMQKALDRAGVDLSDLTLDQDSDGWKISGHSKYEAEGIYSLARDITRRHPGARAEVFQEWDTRDADEPGQSLDVYTRRRVSGGARSRVRPGALRSRRQHRCRARGAGRQRGSRGRCAVAGQRPRRRAVRGGRHEHHHRPHIRPLPRGRDDEAYALGLFDALDEIAMQLGVHDPEDAASWLISHEDGERFLLRREDVNLDG